MPAPAKMTKKKFPLFDCVQRKRHSKGFGVHSPFAFDLITNIIYIPSPFYAFSDIQNHVGKSNEVPLSSTTKFNKLTFRIIQRFKPENILEINSGRGIGTLFILAPDKRIRCTCIENDKTNILLASKLLGENRDRVILTGEEEFRSGEKYDAICMHLSGNINFSPEQLFAKSREDAFWIIEGINNRYAKQFWANIVNDERARFTFDMKHSGIVFLKSSYHKLNFLI